ncbi:hypothetical protein LTR17_008977 [Elasticomyces elasticus]|nr:hypothetical protein LTR17_008977 [Elasticomyces elasticus]
MTEVNTGGGSGEPDHCMDRRSSSSMTDKVARYRQLHAETSQTVAEYKPHVSTLVEHAGVLTDRVQIILDSLNSAYEVKRITVAEFGPLEFKDRAAEFVLAAAPREMSTNLYEAVVLECAIPLDRLRAGVAAVAVKAVQLAQDSQVDTLDIDDLVVARMALRECGAVPVDLLWGCVTRIVDAYRYMLGSLAQLLAKTDLSLRTLKERAESMRGNISEEAVSTLLAAPEDTADTEYYQDAWMKVRAKAGAPLARSIVADYEGLKAEYEATFASAVKLAPDVFAYPDWSTAKAE